VDEAKDTSFSKMFIEMQHQTKYLLGFNTRLNSLEKKIQSQVDILERSLEAQNNQIKNLKEYFYYSHTIWSGFDFFNSSQLLWCGLLVLD